MMLTVSPDTVKVSKLPKMRTYDPETWQAVVDVVAQVGEQYVKRGELTATARTHDEALLDLDSLIKDLA
jgi:hypothetical protein